MTRKAKNAVASGACPSVCVRVRQLRSIPREHKGTDLKRNGLPFISNALGLQSSLVRKIYVAPQMKLKMRKGTRTRSKPKQQPRGGLRPPRAPEDEEAPKRSFRLRHLRPVSCSAAPPIPFPPPSSKSSESLGTEDAEFTRLSIARHQWQTRTAGLLYD
eukprot:TRINITY_DN30530_c0_g1_i1.p1 TRINITY_DN30530_c0_g1~~TRINITY_DN30530_c0_g1_i1.p1  ORF type:complete len:159 (-),score=16.22 TRINITY_DN30530_c0_g1_i1:41-517(-)